MTDQTERTETRRSPPGVCGSEEPLESLGLVVRDAPGRAAGGRVARHVATRDIDRVHPPRADTGAFGAEQEAERRRAPCRSRFRDDPVRIGMAAAGTENGLVAGDGDDLA